MMKRQIGFILWLISAAVSAGLIIGLAASRTPKSVFISETEPLPSEHPQARHSDFSNTARTDSRTKNLKAQISSVYFKPTPAAEMPDDYALAETNALSETVEREFYRIA